MRQRRSATHGCTGAWARRRRSFARIEAVDCGRSSTAAQGAADQSPNTELTFIELALVDGDGKSVGFVSYSVTAPDGKVFSGMLDAGGRARIDGVAKGNCEVRFPEFHGADWSAA